MTPIYVYETDCKESYVLRKLRRGLSAIETGCERNEDKTQTIYFFHTLRPPEAHLTLNGRNIPFVNYAKYLSVIVDNRITWRVHTEMTEVEDFRTSIRTYSQFKSERLGAKH
jgi:hypothetical protein